MSVSRSQPQITDTAAARVVDAAVEHARASGLNVCVAVVDSCGLLTAFRRMPGAPLHSSDIAIDKAYTAASFGMATSQWGDIMPKYSASVQRGVPLRARMIQFGGGLPILRDGVVIGAVGVSGADERQDEECARSGCDAIEA
jgi:uncharacterized protein GlcG (DUF336 family)